METQIQSKSLFRLRLRVRSHPCAAPNLLQKVGPQNHLAGAAEYHTVGTLVPRQNLIRAKNEPILPASLPLEKGMEPETFC
jgi:hypothetical protein